MESTFLNKGGILLIILYKKGGIAFESELINITKFSPGTIQSWKERLKEKGYIEVTKDKNKVYIKLTKKGKEIAERLITLETRIETIVEEK
ncbi:Transcriptional regulator, wHTH [Saccharolobus shibatae B12]|uniref:Transcriptional regulator, wHTH n=1 Tax=Saccharolobus shibatae (strain ATCC 51178 / DSM 5389 / JCM 8931 / NBRC 15437 / B12) TaxID=523848 RepID=A0A8F5GS78_SACSH|nr:hypothetical protein [Saccharolobus shibatae]QXJ27107.1 Transcriptional regulator, wHTH [Saccharolobus shibatae B12]QXJ30000.1 Transcriptional regulator, wHTH [Saccharolobus shibatae B12]